MAQRLVQLPYAYYPDPTRGRPVFFGSIYVGEVGADPQIDPIQAYISQEDGNVVAVDQPILTGAGGVPMYNGSPAAILADSAYSLAVLDSDGQQVYYAPDSELGQGEEPTDIYIPLAGTDVGAPVTGLIEITNTAVQGRQWQFGVLPGFGINDMSIAAQGVNAASSTMNITLGVNNWFQFAVNGNDVAELLLPFDPESAMAAVTKQYADSLIGGTGYVPLAGTASGPGGPVTGLIEIESVPAEREWTFGILEGFTDEMALSATGVNAAVSAFAITMGAGVAFTFNHATTPAQITLPDIDYTAADDLSAVTKEYVDTQAGSGLFIPLAGTTDPNNVTGIITHERNIAGDDHEYNVGILEGFSTDGFIITTTAQSTPNSRIWIQNLGSSWLFGNNGVLLQSNPTGNSILDLDAGVGFDSTLKFRENGVTKGNIEFDHNNTEMRFVTDGTTAMDIRSGGLVQCLGNLGVDGGLVVAGLGNFGQTLVVSGDPTIGDHVGNRDYNDARYLGISATAANSSALGGIAPSFYVNTNSAQNITGHKDFQGGMSVTVNDVGSNYALVLVGDVVSGNALVTAASFKNIMANFIAAASIAPAAAAPLLAQLAAIPETP